MGSAFRLFLFDISQLSSSFSCFFFRENRDVFCLPTERIFHGPLFFFLSNEPQQTENLGRGTLFDIKSFETKMSSVVPSFKISK